MANLFIGHEDAGMKLTTSVRTATGLRLSLREQFDPFDLTVFLERFFRACKPSEGLQCGADREKQLDIRNQSCRCNTKET